MVIIYFVHWSVFGNWLHDECFQARMGAIFKLMHL